MLPEPHRSVLIVEDNRDEAETLAALLDLSGFAVRIAYDGADGLQSACEHPPDVVILDIALPRMNGLELARQLRAALKRETLLVAMSGYTHKHAECCEAGIDRYFIKPVHPETIQAVLRDRAVTHVTPA
jgi:DNA-binding response OmpR family regulator